MRDRCHEYTIKAPTRNTPITVWFVGDSHIGAIGCAEDKLAETVQAIAEDPLAYFIGMGDYCDFIGFRDRRFDPGQIDPAYKVADLSRLAEKQLRHFCKIMNPIRHKCIGWITGNHEESWERHYHFSPTHYLEAWAREQNPQCARLAYEELVRVNIYDDKAKRMRYLVDIYAHHGWGASRTEGADLNKVISLMLSIDADVYAMGHGHKLLYDGHPRVGLQKAKSRSLHLRQCERPLAFFLTGSYLKTYGPGESTYAAKKGLRAVTLGSPRLVMQMRGVKRGIEELYLAGHIR